MRVYSALDKLVINADRALTSVCGAPPITGRADPAAGLENGELSAAQTDLAGRLMRVNHVGEVCAQALYQGQALTARNQHVRGKLEQAAAEENDHLVWCEQRLQDLHARKSLLNPLWYAGSFAIGATAGLAGDRWSLGFLAETERQVESHLERHLTRLPADDRRSRAVVTQMKQDESRHATTATQAGGRALPGPLVGLMRRASRLMTGTAYWI